MSSLNQVQIIGNLGKDPEMKYMPSGDPVVSVSIATSESWKDKQSGESKEKTEWHNVVFFGKLAEIVDQYLKKGSKVFVQGKLRTRKWEKDGVDRYSTEIVVDGFGGKMVMLGGKDGGSESRPSNANSNQRTSQQTPQRTEPAASSSSGGFEDDDIPF